jgi:UPF0271 protein
MRIDLNCDMGESFGRYGLGEDEKMLRIVTSANIACGLHAGDPLVMAQTLALAKQNRVAVGAHPGYPDLQGFGRRHMKLSPEELEAFILYQIGALAAFARANGVPLVHVKPHGALYNTVMQEAKSAQAVARAVAAFDPGLIVVALPGSALEQMARAIGLRVAREGFVDRAYCADGSLAPRNEPGAVIHDPAQAATRAVRMALSGQVETTAGSLITLKLDTLCIHGDTPGAAAMAAQVRAALEAAQVRIAPLDEDLK